MVRRNALVALCLVLAPWAWMEALRPLLAWSEIHEAVRASRRHGVADVRALAHLARADALAPGCTYAPLIRGVWFLGLGREEEAWRHLDEFVASRQDDAALLLDAVRKTRPGSPYPLGQISPATHRLSAHSACMLAAIALHYRRVDAAGDFLRQASRYRNRSIVYEYLAGLQAALQERFQAALQHMEQASALRFGSSRIPNLGFELTVSRLRLVEEDGRVVLQESPWEGKLEPFEVGSEREVAELLYNLVVLYRARGNFWRSFFMAEILEKNKADAIHRQGLSAMLDLYLYPRNYASVVEPRAVELGLDPLLVYAVMRRESCFNPKAQSSAGAIGLMQLLPSTARRVAREAGERHFQESWLTEPSRNIELGCRYMARLFKEFSDAPDPVPWVLAAYNAGPQRARRWLDRWKRRGSRGDIVESLHIRETRGYVEKVQAAYQRYRHLYGNRRPGASSAPTAPRPASR